MASRSPGHAADLTARTRAGRPESTRAESTRAESIETVASSLGRVGILLAADRVELWRLSDRTHVVLQASWQAAGSVTSVESSTARSDQLEVAWFPWGLGNVRPHEYLFVRNAGPLPTRARGSQSMADASVGSSLHVPLVSSEGPAGALCAMWTEEREGWPFEKLAKLTEIGLSALDLAG